MKEREKIVLQGLKKSFKNGNDVEETSFTGKVVYADGGKTLVSYVGRDKGFDVPEGVETIGRKAFARRNTLQEVKLPESLRTIDDDAFFDCENLQSITIREGVKRIGDCAFGENISLKEIVFTGTPEKIKRSAFTGCDNLRTITIPLGSIAKFRKIARDYEDRIVEKDTATTGKEKDTADTEKTNATATTDTRKTDESNALKSKEVRKSPMYK